MVKYEEIANILRKRIQDGTYPSNSLLPNQVTLVEEFNVSRMTLKKALSILTMEGLISSQRGVGTHVLSHSFQYKETFPATIYHGLTKQMVLENKQVTSQVIEFDVLFPPTDIQERLLLEPEQPVYKIIRLRKLDGLPYIVEHTYMPVALVPGLTKIILEASIYEYLEQSLAIEFGGAFRTIQADKSDSYDQEYLQCSIHDPILEVEQLVYLKNGRPLEYSRSRNRYDIRGYSVIDVK